jgi:aminoglycoside phosphotransferase (APT) family kinase protein
MCPIIIGAGMNVSIEKRIQKNFPDTKLVRTWSLTGGMSASMTALEWVTPSGELSRAILRQPEAAVMQENPQAARNEFRLLDLLHKQGLAVPKPLFLEVDDQTSHATGLVIEYIEGEMDFTSSSLEDRMSQLAEQLARLHRLETALFDLSFLPEKTGCRETVLSPGPGAQQALETLSFQPMLIEMPCPTGQIALLHGDYWPGNVLWQDGRLAAVIDWEDACLGDPLSDLAISRLDIACIYDAAAMQVFTRGYRSFHPIDLAGLPYWDLCAALRLARLVGDDLEGWAGYFHMYGREDITPQKIRCCYRKFVERAVREMRAD